MSEPHTEVTPDEGGPAQKSTLDSGGHRIPLPLILIWAVFFVWMVAYLATYMVPALPK